MITLNQVYYIKHIKTIAYHPQGNNQIERINKTIKDILAKCTLRNSDWSHYMQSAAYAVQVSRSASTKYSPAELLTGRKFRQLFDRRYQEPPDQTNIKLTADQEFNRISQVRLKAKGFIKSAQ